MHYIIYYIAIIINSEENIKNLILVVVWSYIMTRENMFW